MKVYQCDSCEKTITNPYEEKMKEFYVGCHFEYEGVFPENSKRKVKVHLCEDCFNGLHAIAEKKAKAMQADKPHKKKIRLPTAIGKAEQKNNCKYILNGKTEKVKPSGKECADG